MQKCIFFTTPNPLPGVAVARGVMLEQTSFKTTHYHQIFKEPLKSPCKVHLFHGLNPVSHSSWKGDIMRQGLGTS